MTRKSGIFSGIALLATSAAILGGQAVNPVAPDLKGSAHAEWRAVVDSDSDDAATAINGIWRLQVTIPGQDTICEERWWGHRDGTQATSSPTMSEDVEFHVFATADKSVQWSSSLALDQDRAAVIPLDFGTSEVALSPALQTLANQATAARAELELREDATVDEFRVKVHPGKLVTDLVRAAKHR